MRTDHEGRGSVRDHGGRSSVRGAPEHGKRRSVRAGKKRLIATMRGGGEWGQEKHGDRISASGSVGAEGKGGAREEQTLLKTDTKHKNKTLGTKNNEYIQTLAESNAQMCFKCPKSCMNVIIYMQQ